MKRETILGVLAKYADFKFELHYEGYAEPGYDDPKSGIIATGNWNSCTVTKRIYDKPLPGFLKVKDQDATFTYEDRTMPRVSAMLEKLGVKIEWEDEWAFCDECYKLVRTSPDNYSWMPSYWAHVGGLLCKACVLEDPEDYLQSLKGNEQEACTFDIDLEDQEYREVDEQFQHGLHGGQNSDPKVIAKSLRKQGIVNFIFKLDCVGQFDQAFSVWVHKTEYDRLDVDSLESAGPDPAKILKAALAGLHSADMGNR